MAQTRQQIESLLDDANTRLALAVKSNSRGLITEIMELRRRLIEELAEMDGDEPVVSAEGPGVWRTPWRG